MKAEINIYTVLLILFIHWFVDFVFQSDKDAKGKSTSMKCLISHTLTYSLCWMCMIQFLGFWNALIFIGITFICHIITDYFTSRLNSRLYKAGKIHEFFISVGFDQLLHFTQLLLWNLLLKLMSLL